MWPGLGRIMNSSCPPKSDSGKPSVPLLGIGLSCLLVVMLLAAVCLIALDFAEIGASMIMVVFLCMVYQQSFELKRLRRELEQLRAKASIEQIPESSRETGKHNPGPTGR